MTLNNYDNTLICFAKITSALPSPVTSQVIITPLDETQRYQVQYFRLADQDISPNFGKIMRAIAHAFPKLRGLRLGNASIDRITKIDLELFPELELISLDGNKISALDSDLFTYTPKLKFIYFDNNSISSIDASLLSSLDYIEADFSSNPCIAQKTCKSELLYQKLKDSNPTLYHYYELGAAMQAVLDEDPNYGR